MDIRDFNRRAWDHQVDSGNAWTVPVSPEVIAAARRGQWSIVLTEQQPVPRAWFPADLHGLDVLCLASGGGQQGPVLAAAGARVTVYDNSPRQLAQDQAVAAREGLRLTTVEGDMRALTALGAESFDLIVHPVSNLFVPDVRPVWTEAARVLRPGGTLLAGFMNPAMYIFDYPAAERGELIVKHSLPYSDLEQAAPEVLADLLARHVPLEWGHTLTDLIGGQLDAGLRLAAMYEDRTHDHPLAKHMATYVATRAVKA
jgi:SAM-dependent methyltransferase